MTSSKLKFHVNRFKMVYFVSEKEEDEDRALLDQRVVDPSIREPQRHSSKWSAAAQGAQGAYPRRCDQQVSTCSTDVTAGWFRSTSSSSHLDWVQVSCHDDFVQGSCQLRR